MAVKLEFDHANVVNAPTIVLAKKGGKKLGTIPATSIHFDDNFNSMNTITFKVNNENSGIKTRLWNEIKNFKLIWCKEWDAWFEITVEIDESNELIKNIEGHSIGESELSAIKLYNIHINTEEDIALDDYVPTILYDEDYPRASLLGRIMEKVPHYTIKYVDTTIASIQRSFSFNDISLLDAFNEIGNEIGCIFILSQKSDSNGLPERGIYVYDLMNNCSDCGYREEGMHICRECGSTNIIEGYGTDTNVFVSNENIAKEITLTTDASSVNNCFKLEAGDDLMTATIMGCNPNGSAYIWYITDENKTDMSTELVQKLSEYDTLYAYYQQTYQSDIDDSLLSDYNELVTKYSIYNSDLQNASNAVGFSNIINIIYNAIDFELFLTSGLIPSVSMSDTNATEQAALLTSNSLSPVAVSNITNISKSTVDLNVLALAKSIVRSTYRVTINSSSFNSSALVWTGTFNIENYSDENDVANSSSVSIIISDDYKTFIEQKIKRMLSKSNDDKYDITGLFKKSLSFFKNELKRYALNSLKSFHNNCQSCIDILSEEGIADATTWLNANDDLYDRFYSDYYSKLQAIESEISLRESEIDKIKALSEAVNELRKSIQETLDFKTYVGETLWKELCSYRRESLYSNSNYISDGLSNSELLDRAKEFIGVAKRELIKSATLQHSISTTLNNLLVLKEFHPIVNAFSVGNWIRVRIDGNIYKLRLISYSIDFDELDELSVEFSDVIKCGDDLSDLKSVLGQASSIATSYQSVERQATQGSNSNRIIKTWFEDGLNATLTKIMSDADNQNMTFDNHGLLMRKFDDVTENYSREQLRILNSTILITDDNWVTAKTAIGKFFYVDPMTGNLKQAYGVNGETIVGKMIIGQSLAIYNTDNTLKFDENGLMITNDTNTFIVNPNASKLLSVLNDDVEIMSLNTYGELSLTGAITATSLSLGNNVMIPSAKVEDINVYIKQDGTLGIGTPGDGVTGFTISTQGLLTASNAVIYGTVYASAGTFTGAITATSLTLGSNVTIPYSSVSNTPDLTVYIAKDGTIGTVADGSTGFTVSTQGLLQASNAIIYGTIYASAGTIAGWNITTNRIYGGDSTTGVAFIQLPHANAAHVFGAGGTSHSNYSDCPFRVTKSGKLYATNAEITGKIIATSGSIGGFVIGASGLYGSGGNIEISQDRLYLSTTFNPATNAFYVITGSNKNYIALRGASHGAYFGNLPDTAEYDELILNTGVTWGAYFTTSATIYSNYSITLDCGGAIALKTSQTDVRAAANSSLFYPYEDDWTSLGFASGRWKEIFSTNGTINTSDLKEKDIIGDIDFAEELIMGINPVVFMWKKGDHRRKRMGVIAQEVSELCKNIGENLSLVTASYKWEQEKGYYGEDVDDSLLTWGTSYEQLIAPMISVIQSQNKKIKILENKISLLLDKEK